MSSPTTSEPQTETPTAGGNGPQTGEQSPPDQRERAGIQPGEPEGPAGNGERGALSLDLVFEILKNSRRREVLRYLKEHRERVTLSELAEHVAAIENDTTVQALSSQQRKRVYVGLYQCHLPKLDDMDVIEFNQSRGHVELGPNAPQLDKYLYMDEADAEERPWYRYYLGLSGLGVVVVAGGATSGVLASPAALFICAGIVVGVLGLAVAQAHAEGAV